jgi:hypothetical protein
MPRALDETGPPPGPCRPDLRATRSVTRKIMDAQPPFVESTKVSLRQPGCCTGRQRRRRTRNVRYTPGGHVLVGCADGEALAAGCPQADRLADAPVLSGGPAGAGRQFDRRAGRKGLALGKGRLARRAGLLGGSLGGGENDGGDDESRTTHGLSLAPRSAATNSEGIGAGGRISAACGRRSCS